MVAAYSIVPRVEPALRAPRVVGTAVAFPPHRHEQAELARAAAVAIPALERRAGFIERFFARVGVDARHLALPLERYMTLGGLEERNQVWIEAGAGR